jgi:hypothetical protein
MEDITTTLPVSIKMDDVKMDTLESLSNHMETTYPDLFPTFKKYYSKCHDNILIANI